MENPEPDFVMEEYTYLAPYHWKRLTSHPAMGTGQGMHSSVHL